jgi:hypothetical protein
MTRSEPHWLINDADAKLYGTAFANAMRHFPVKVAQKSIDVATLIFVAFQIETPRLVMSRQLAAQRGARPNRGPAQVFQFRQPSQQSPATATQTPPTAQGPGVEPPMAEGPLDFDVMGGGLPQ